MNIKAIAALGVAGLLLAGCSQSTGPREDFGAVAGAIAGGVIGNQFGSGSGRIAATAAGAVIGGVVGSAIGRSLDEADRRALYDAEYRALEYGPPNTPVEWRNPNSGRYGNVTPGPRYRSANAYDCRDYTHTIYIDGRPEVARGTACRQPDGTWRPVG